MIEVFSSEFLATFFFSWQLSLKVALVSTFFVTIVGLYFAFLLSQVSQAKFRGKEFLDVCLTLPLILPPSIIGYYLILLLGREGVIGKFFYHHFQFSFLFTWVSAACASFIVSLPLMIRVARGAIDSVDKNYIHVSYILGNNKRRTFFKVILPLSKKGIYSGIVLSFVRALGEFGATLMVAGNIPGKTNTVPLLIYSMAENGQWTQLHFIVAIYTFFSFCLLFLSARFFRNGRGF